MFFDLGCHSRAMHIDGFLDATLLFICRLAKIRLKAAGDVEARVFEPAKEQFFDLIVVEPNTELPMQLAGHLYDLSGIAHDRILCRRVYDSKPRSSRRVGWRQVDSTGRSARSVGY